MSALVLACNPADAVAPRQRLGFEVDTLPGLRRDAAGLWHLPLWRDRWQTIQRIQGRVTSDGPTRPAASSPNEFIEVGWESSHSWLVDRPLVFVVRRKCPTQPDAICVYVINGEPWPRDTVILTQFAGVEVPTVNCCSYSSADGEVSTMFAPVLSMLGDTVTVTATADFTDYRTGRVHTSLTRQVRIVLE